MQPSSPTKSKTAARVAARLEFLEEDPLDFWDFGMIFAFDLIAERIQQTAGVNQIVTVASTLQLLAEERNVVVDSELHTFWSARQETSDLPRVASAARMAAARSAKKRRPKSIAKPTRLARSFARAAV